MFSEVFVCLLGVSQSLLGGSPLSRGSGLCPGGSLSERPPYGNKWAVHILLECILVFPVCLKDSMLCAVDGPNKNTWLYSFTTIQDETNGDLP